ncbi:MAG: hypothetical protein Q9170_005403 [Blastenia crenularia]
MSGANLASGSSVIALAVLNLKLIIFQDPATRWETADAYFHRVEQESVAGPSEQCHQGPYTDASEPSSSNNPEPALKMNPVPEIGFASNSTSDINSIYTPTSSDSDPSSKLHPKTCGQVPCYGCDRRFSTFASMFAHLEEGDCITDHAELGRLAVNHPHYSRYIRYSHHEYLRTSSGEEQISFDTDNESTWECVECGRVYFTRNHADKHAKSSAHRPDAFKCPSCSTFFRALSALIQHVDMARACPYSQEYEGAGPVGWLVMDVGEYLQQKREDRGGE